MAATTKKMETDHLNPDDRSLLNSHVINIRGETGGGQSDDLTNTTLEKSTLKTKQRLIWMSATKGRIVNPSLSSKTHQADNIINVFWASFLHRESSDTGGPSILDNIQHHSRCSGKDNSTGSMRTSGSTTWVWMVGRRAQHMFLCI